MTARAAAVTALRADALTSGPATAVRAWRAAAIVATVMSVLGDGQAAAQSRGGGGPAFRPWRPVISLGAAWTGADDLGRVDATTRRATAGTLTPPAFTLFQTESSLDAGAAAEAAITLPVHAEWAVAVRGAAARPTLTTTISADVEASQTVTASERLSDYTVDVSLLYQPGRFGLAQRARPYLVAGGGYLRQLHEDNALVETGRSWHAGAGVRLWLRGADRRSLAVGLTGELRWTWRTDGITFADGARSRPAAALALFVGL